MKPVFEEVNCNLCGQNDYTIIYKAKPIEDIDLAKVYSASGHDFLKEQVVKCKNCGFMYINPRIKGDLVVKGYSDAVDPDHVSQGDGRMATFKDGMKIISKLYPNKGKLLDVGSAGGFFVKAAEEEGWEGYGVEPSKWMVDWGKKNLGLKNFKSGTLESAKYPDNYFDVVTLWDVLEHVPDPSATLREVNRILKPGGLVVINYPNIGSKLAKMAGRKWWFLLSIHLYYFTPETISKMLEKEKFTPFYYKRHWQKLALGYLFYRVEPYSKGLSKILVKAASKLGLAEKQVSYYASQALVAARKQ
ncbi:class I SAM-dependent methyltransferase [Candidatus Micrarchaeota archaeon]|nr:class I SAM-dependent methyltransferase [Candidatus Micrarchaeota archaeon]